MVASVNVEFAVGPGMHRPKGEPAKEIRAPSFLLCSRPQNQIGG